MRRRLNSTGRQKITADAVAIRLLDGGDGVQYFDANLSGLSAMGLDPNARVVVEAYVKTSSMRFDFGTVGTLSSPANTGLDEIDRGAGILFKVKVVDVHGVPGRLLAASGALHPRDESDEEDNRKSLLPMREVDLGEEVWQLELEGGPMLLINRAVPDLAYRLGSDPVLQGAVFPSIVRAVLKQILTESIADDEEWVTDWLTFFSKLLGEAVMVDISEEDHEDLLDRTVKAFNQAQRWVARAKQQQPPAQVAYE